MSDEILKTLQVMAWERAKGELKSILSTIRPDYNDDDHHEDYYTMKSIIDNFINDMENETIVG